MIQIRDLRALWSAEVTRNTAEVTHPNPLEVTQEATQVTPGAAEVTARPRDQLTWRSLGVTPPEDAEGAGTPTTFTTVERRRDDPAPELGALLSKLAEEAPYPMSSSRVTEVRRAKERRAKERRTKERSQTRGAVPTHRLTISRS